MARLYADENVPLSVVAERRRLGHDVETSQEAGHAGRAMEDEAVLAYATRQHRAALTLNRRHFIRLHGSDRKHGGILGCSFGRDFPEPALRIHEAIGARSGLSDELVRVSRPGAQ